MLIRKPFLHWVYIGIIFLVGHFAPPKLIWIIIVSTDLSVLLCFCSLAHKEKWSVETNVIKTWTCYWILPGIRTDCMIPVEEDW